MRADTNDVVTFRCNFIMACSGYYSYDGGYTPEFKGRDHFRGDIVHPQEWPENLDYRDRRIAVIGSGSTAVTMIPALAKNAQHVVMVQRSPTYIVSLPEKDHIVNILRKLLPERLAYRIARWKNIRMQLGIYHRARKSPERVRRIIMRLARKDLGKDFDVETHFSPRYAPWDQRLCVIPDADLFHAIRSGKASVVTGQIDAINAAGIRMKSGEQVDADIIVTATGLDVVLLGNVRFIVDGQPVDFSKTFSYRSMMFSDVPNLISTFGYINASWTLKADLTAEYACRLLNHMQNTGTRQCTPRLGEDDRDMPSQDWITAFSSGYVQRKMHLLPRQGDREPWLNTQDYMLDRRAIPASDLDDGVLEFSSRCDAIVSKPLAADALVRDDAGRSRFASRSGRSTHANRAGRHRGLPGVRRVRAAASHTGGIRLAGGWRFCRPQLG